MLQKLFEDEDVGKALDDSKEVIHQFVDFIDSEPEGNGYPQQLEAMHSVLFKLPKAG